MTRFCIVAMTVLAACNLTDKTIKLKSDAGLENKFEQMTTLALNDTVGITFRLDTLTNFPWDTLIIVTPYYPIDRLENELKIDLTEIKNTKIVSNEVSNVLAFIKNGQLVNYVDLPRDKGDFAHPDTIRVFGKDNCIFELERTNSKFMSGQPVVLVKPQRSND